MGVEQDGGDNDQTMSLSEKLAEHKNRLQDQKDKESKKREEEKLEPIQENIQKLQDDRNSAQQILSAVEKGYSETGTSTKEFLAIKKSINELYNDNKEILKELGINSKKEFLESSEFGATKEVKEHRQKLEALREKYRDIHTLEAQTFIKGKNDGGIHQSDRKLSPGELFIGQLKDRIKELDNQILELYKQTPEAEQKISQKIQHEITFVLQEKGGKDNSAAWRTGFSFGPKTNARQEIIALSQSIIESLDKSAIQIEPSDFTALSVSRIKPMLRSAFENSINNEIANAIEKSEVCGINFQDAEKINQIPNIENLKRQNILSSNLPSRQFVEKLTAMIKTNDINLQKTIRYGGEADKWYSNETTDSTRIEYLCGRLLIGAFTWADQYSLDNPPFKEINSTTLPNSTSRRMEAVEEAIKDRIIGDCETVNSNFVPSPDINEKINGFFKEYWSRIEEWVDVDPQGFSAELPYLYNNNESSIRKGEGLSKELNSASKTVEDREKLIKKLIDISKSFNEDFLYTKLDESPVQKISVKEVKEFFSTNMNNLRKGELNQFVAGTLENEYKRENNSGDLKKIIEEAIDRAILKIQNDPIYKEGEHYDKRKEEFTELLYGINSMRINLPGLLDETCTIKYSHATKNTPQNVSVNFKDIEREQLFQDIQELRKNILNLQKRIDSMPNKPQGLDLFKTKEKNLKEERQLLEEQLRNIKEELEIKLRGKNEIENTINKIGSGNRESWKFMDHANFEDNFEGNSINEFLNILEQKIQQEQQKLKSNWTKNKQKDYQKKLSNIGNLENAKSI